MLLSRYHLMAIYSQKREALISLWPLEVLTAPRTLSRSPISSAELFRWVSFSRLSSSSILNPPEATLELLPAATISLNTFVWIFYIFYGEKKTYMLLGFLDLSISHFSSKDSLWHQYYHPLRDENKQTRSNTISHHFTGHLDIKRCLNKGIFSSSLHLNLKSNAWSFQITSIAIEIFSLPLEHNRPEHIHLGYWMSLVEVNT